MKSRGFTLVELLIGVVIIAGLMLMALPAYNQFMAGVRVRAAAESLVHGAKLAQVEAIKRNRIVEFEFTPNVGWAVRDPDPDQGGLIQEEPFVDANATVVVEERPNGSMVVTYSPLGQFRPTNEDGTTGVQVFRVTSTISPKRYMAVVDPGLSIGIRLCDRDFADSDPAGCPNAVTNL